MGVGKPSMESDRNHWGWMWAIFTVRWVLGLIFFMAGWWKCFLFGSDPEVGALKEQSRAFFVTWFKDTWIPEWLLWSLGMTIPVVELLAGALLCLGLLRRPACLAIAAILVTVTYGHLLLEPLFDTTSHIFPRLILLVLVMLAPQHLDRLSLDAVIGQLRGSNVSPRNDT